MITYEKYPAVKFALLFIAGILLGQYVLFNIYVVVSLFLLCFILCIIKSKHSNNKSEIFIIVSLIIILAGIGKANIDFYVKPLNSVKNFPDTDISRDIQLKGIITEPPDYDSSRVKFLIDCQAIMFEGDTTFVSGKLLAFLYPDKKLDERKPLPLFNAGDEILTFGKLSTAPTEKIPGGFNYKKYLELHGIDKIFKIKGYDNVIVLSENNLNFLFKNIIYPAREFALKTIDDYNSREVRAFLKGLVVGERSEMSVELKESFINSGLMHIIAVSGLNVAYIVLFLTIILSLFRLKTEYRTVVIIIFLIFYCLFTGAPASIVRASIMGALILIAFIIQRKVVFLNIIAFSIILILSYDSRQIFDAGFILSYSAIISIALFYEKIELLLKSIFKFDENYNKILFYLIVLIASSISAQIGVLPITTLYFGKISFVSFFTNIIVIPVSNFCLALGFLQIIFNLFSGIFASAIAELNNLILTATLEFIKWSGNLSFSYSSVLNFNFTSAIAYYIILFLIFTAKTSNFKKRTIVSFFIILFVLIFNFKSDNNIRITFFDVGQGDATLIETSNGTNILIDAGGSYQGISSARKSIIPYLQQKNISTIHLLIITHKHQDHIGGIYDIIKNFNVGRILDTKFKDTSKLSVMLDNLIIEKKIIRDFVEAGDIVELPDSSKIFILYPSRIRNPLLEMNSHFNCITLKYKYKNLDVLFTSDIGKGTEEILKDCYGNFLKADILKVAHHGSKNSTSAEFLVKVKPVFSVISCGLNNRFNHPTDITLSKLILINSKICRTDYESSIIFESDGENLKRIYY